jgi:hypothetical protein
VRDGRGASHPAALKFLRGFSMTNNYLDRSNYVKGLLLLIGKDNRITDGERDFLHKIGGALSFDKKFIENAINELFDNEYLGSEPPVFSRKQFAEVFLRDAIRLALVDNDLNNEEFEWLQTIAKVNHISHEWLENELECYQNSACALEAREPGIEKIFNSNNFDLN